MQHVLSLKTVRPIQDIKKNKPKQPATLMQEDCDKVNKELEERRKKRGRKDGDVFSVSFTG